jgi:hypothetical protein
MVAHENDDFQVVEQWEPVTEVDVQTPLEVYEELAGEGSNSIACHERVSAGVEGRARLMSGAESSMALGWLLMCSWHIVNMVLPWHDELWVELGLGSKELRS